MKSVVVTLIGPDRPGLVEIVSDVVRRAGGNWLESRMAHLSGQFAGIVMVEIADDAAETLVRDLQSLTQHGLKVVVEQDVAHESTPTSQQIAQLSVVGNDRPGIVSEVSQVLANHRVNVEQFGTDCSDAPLAGGRIFRADALLCLPAGVTLDSLQISLEQIATDLMVDITLKTE